MVGEKRHPNFFHQSLFFSRGRAHLRDETQMSKVDRKKNTDPCLIAFYMENRITHFYFRKGFSKRGYYYYSAAHVTQREELIKGAAADLSSSAAPGKRCRLGGRTIQNREKRKSLFVKRL